MRFEALFATAGLDNSEARNDQGRRVKQELKNLPGMIKLLRLESHKIMFFCRL